MERLGLSIRSPQFNHTASIHLSVPIFPMCSCIFTDVLSLLRSCPKFDLYNDKTSPTVWKVSSLWHHSFISSVRRPSRLFAALPNDTGIWRCIKNSNWIHRRPFGLCNFRIQGIAHETIKKHKYNSSLKTDIYRAGATVIPDPGEQVKRMKRMKSLDLAVEPALYTVSWWAETVEACHDNYHHR